MLSIRESSSFERFLLKINSSLSLMNRQRVLWINVTEVPGYVATDQFAVHTHLLATHLEL